jgi:uncharacterized membrane protein
VTDASPPSPPSAPAAASNGLGRWKWLLIASLAINLLVIGAIAGARFHGHRGWRGERSAEEFGLIGYARHLPAERRKLIRKIVFAEKGAISAARAEVYKARQEAAAVLVEEPFSADKLKAAAGRISEAEAKLKAAGLAAFLSAAEQLTVEERKGLLEHLKRRHTRHFRFGDGEDGPPPPPPPAD